MDLADRFGNAYREFSVSDAGTPPRTSDPASGIAERGAEPEPVLLESVLLESGEAPDAEARDAGPGESRAAASAGLPADPLAHWVYLALAVGVIGLATILRVRGEHQVVVPWLDEPLPEVCTFKRYLGIGCPGCGLTRSFISLADGRLGRAWHFNPAGLAAAALVIGQLPYRAVQLWRLRRGLPELAARRWGSGLILIIAIALFAQWIVRLVTGVP